jgi:hypothetical protein
MMARLATNVSISLLPFYLAIVLHAGGVDDPNDLARKLLGN